MEGDQDHLLHQWFELCWVALVEFEFISWVSELPGHCIVVLQLDGIPHDVDGQCLGPELASNAVESCCLHLNAEDAMFTHLSPNLVLPWVVESFRREDISHVNISSSLLEHVLNFRALCHLVGRLQHRPVG